MKIHNAIAVGSVTLVGHSGPFPRKRGNCFDVICKNTKTIRIVNLNYENLRHLLSLGTIYWPIRVLEIGEGTGIIYDARVPDDFIDKEWCTTCCSERLLPMSQRIERRMHIAKGEIRIKRCKCEDGSVFTIQSQQVGSRESTLRGK